MQGKVIEFWRAVEMFSPPAIPPLARWIGVRPVWAPSPRTREMGVLDRIEHQFFVDRETVKRAVLLVGDRESAGC